MNKPNFHNLQSQIFPFCPFYSPNSFASLIDKSRFPNGRQLHRNCGPSEPWLDPEDGFFGGQERVRQHAAQTEEQHLWVQGQPQERLGISGLAVKGWKSGKSGKKGEKRRKGGNREK